jgi:hypothetical protein
VVRFRSFPRGMHAASTSKRSGGQGVRAAAFSSHLFWSSGISVAAKSLLDSGAERVISHVAEYSHSLRLDLRLRLIEGAAGSNEPAALPSRLAGQIRCRPPGSPFQWLPPAAC